MYDVIIHLKSYRSSSRTEACSKTILSSSCISDSSSFKSIAGGADLPNAAAMESVSNRVVMYGAGDKNVYYINHFQSSI